MLRDVSRSAADVGLELGSILQAEEKRGQRHQVEARAEPRGGALQDPAQRAPADQKQCEGKPPDDVVQNADHGQPAWPVDSDQQHHAERAKDLAEQSNRDDRRAEFQLPRGNQVEQAVDTEDHAQAGPDLRIARCGKREEVEETLGPERGPSAEAEVVDSGDQERDAEEPGSAGPGHAETILAAISRSPAAIVRLMVLPRLSRRTRTGRIAEWSSA